MKVRFLIVHEPDGSREVLEVEALGDYISERFYLDKLREGVIERVELPASLVVDYGEWKEFTDDLHNRSHLRSVLGRVFHYQRQLLIAQKFAVDILLDVLKEMNPNASRTGGRPAKQGIEGIRVFDWKNPKSSRIRVTAERAAEIAFTTAARFRAFLKRNPFPWMKNR